MFQNFVCFSALFALAIGGTVPINDGKFVLTSTVSGSSMTIRIVAETTGWVGFGISETGDMTGSDIVIGGFNTATGESYVGDRFARLPGQVPELDQSQDITFSSASENSTHTVFEFSRALNTGDSQDRAVENRDQFIIWAMGETDTIEYHGREDRGSIEYNLMS